MSLGQKLRSIGYEYKTVIVPADQTSVYLDCYESFGWQEDDRPAGIRDSRFQTLRMKRDRTIANRMELTRLQQQFESCDKEIRLLERAKTALAKVTSWTSGIIGSGFVSGAVYAVTRKPPLVIVCVLLAVPGLVCLIIPFLLYRFMVRIQTQKIQPLIEGKQEEIYALCEKGCALL